MSDVSLFRPAGEGRFVPTGAARSPWSADAVHGAAVSALLAGRLVPDHGTIVRLTVEILAPVPLEPLTLQVGEPRGGRRVTRRDAALSCGERTVATASSVVVATSSLELPDRALAHASPFDPTAVPPLDEPNRAAAEIVGHEGFDSLATILRRTTVDGDDRLHQWIALAMPVVEDQPVHGVELAVVAADYAQNAVFRQLSFEEWTYRNAEQTLHLSRPPVGSWIGARCEAVVQPVGAGFNSADLFDEAGRLGQAAAALVVERRGSDRALAGSTA